jgi:hypothetical protein
MKNPPSITTVHAIQQNMPIHNSLTKVFLIKTSTTWAQYLLILNEFSLNEVHKFFDTINVFTGKQSAMHPTSIHLIKHCKKTHEQVYIQGKTKNLKIHKNFQHHYQDKSL